MPARAVALEQRSETALVAASNSLAVEFARGNGTVAEVQAGFEDRRRVRVLLTPQSEAAPAAPSAMASRGRAAPDEARR